MENKNPEQTISDVSKLKQSGSNPLHPHTQKFYMLLIILGIIFLASIFLSAFYLIGARTTLNQQKQTVSQSANVQKIPIGARTTINQQKQTTLQPSPTINPTTSPVPNGTGANWKTYTATSSGYLFKYPQDWIMQNPHGEGCVPKLYDVNLNIGFHVCGPYDDKNYLTGDMKTIDHWASAAFFNTPYKDKEISREKTIIDGHKSIIQEAQVSPYEINAYIGDVLFTEFLHSATNPKGEFVQAKGHLTITIYIYDKKNLNDAKKIFTQILSTFKFLP